MKNTLRKIDDTQGALRMLLFLSPRVGIPKTVLRVILKNEGIGSRRYDSCFKLLQDLGFLKTVVGEGMKGRAVQKVFLSSEGQWVADLLHELNKRLPEDTSKK